LIKKLVVDNFVKTTYGVLYLWSQKTPRPVGGPLKFLRMKEQTEKNLKNLRGLFKTRLRAGWVLGFIWSG
jgi:hypothetical protein